MSRIGSAFSSFFSILFGGNLPEEVAKEFGYVKKSAKPEVKAEPKPAAPAAPVAKTSDGALQMLGVLQRDSRLVDFLLEDISAYSDDQVGAAVRSMQEQAAAALKRYVTLQPVIDGVEGTFAKASAAGTLAKDPVAVKFTGNVPAQGKPEGGILRHKGWQAVKVDLPEVKPSLSVHIVAPAELEVE